MKFKRNELLSKHTTFRVGGYAKYFCTVKRLKDIQYVFKFAQKERLKVFILGCGSNVLFSNKRFDGIIVKLESKGIQIKGRSLIVEAGTKLTALLNFSVENNLAGFEFLSGIPGTIGGALYMNAGQLNKTIGNLVKRVWVVDSDGKEFILARKKCGFSYRGSLFQEKNWIITKAEFIFKKGNSAKIKEKIKKILKDKLKKQPYDLPSAGSFFKNPKGDFAARLIESAGCKGARVGDAQVSLKHSNFIVNLGNASFNDVEKLSRYVVKKVKEKFKIFLEPEVKFID